jgi:hypothetical protein
MNGNVRPRIVFTTVAALIILVSSIVVGFFWTEQDLDRRQGTTSGNAVSATGESSASDQDRGGLDRYESQYGELPEGARRAAESAQTVGSQDRRVVAEVEVDSLQYVEPGAPRMLNRFTYSAIGWDVWTFGMTVHHGRELEEGQQSCQVRNNNWSAVLQGPCPLIDEVHHSSGPSELGEVIITDDSPVTHAAFELRPDVVEFALSQGEWLRSPKQERENSERARAATRATSARPSSLVTFATDASSMCGPAAACEGFQVSGQEPARQVWAIDADTGILLSNEILLGETLVSSWRLTHLTVAES